MQVLVAPMEALPASLHDNEQQGDTDEDDGCASADTADEADEEQQQMQRQCDEDADSSGEEDDEDEALWQRLQRLQKKTQQRQDKSGNDSGSGVQLLSSASSSSSSDESEQGVVRGRTAAAGCGSAREKARGKRAASPMTADAAASQVSRGSRALLLCR
jgi:hypothetical protein